MTVKRHRGVNLFLWLAYVLALAASVEHVAATIHLVNGGGWWNGWAGALSIDAGLAALAYGIQQKRRSSRRAWGLWAAMAFFALISGLANFRNAVANGAAWGDALAFSATLPVVVIVLGEIISADDAAAADAAERQMARQERQMARQSDAVDAIAAPPAAPLLPAGDTDAALTPAAIYARDNGVSLRTAQRHLKQARDNAPSPAAD